ncbi:Crp/Fnr family transcriptional regulator [Listeria rustica]|uniref:Crp/Fnr family transcriptional regulator n=1 Tax=Listeria rustica TaxID=2713503 RepID=A0A7W1YG32_9LIST|nr:Crp/Fnr family transcriptional regulator [Listeria rustica]MBA3926252.1 Crp/Fnr family transcriptional regulator [Listeria rustica]
MYDKETLESYASFSNIMKILKKDSQFNQFCRQRRVSPGTTETLDNTRKTCLLIESGYVKSSFSGDDDTFRVFYIATPGDFLTLPIVTEYIPRSTDLLAISDGVWWEIDFGYLRKMLALEDPRNYVMLQHAVKIRYKMYVLATVRSRIITAEQRVYFSLMRLSTIGMHVQNNKVELPPFVNYVTIAQLSDASKSYVTIVLKKLRDEGILTSTKKPWVIEDLDAIKKLADFPDMPLF